MKKFLLLFFSFLFINSGNLIAQCAMCRATVENNVNNGEIGIESGLNFGILYLFAAPYILVLIIGIFWFKQSRKQKKKHKVLQFLNTK